MGPIGRVGKLVPVTDVLHAVGLKVGLVAKVDAEAVAKDRQARVRRIVARADHVEPVSLDDVEIAQHMLVGGGIAELGMAVVAVDAHDLDLLAVDVNDLAAHLDRAIADRLGKELAAKREKQGVKARRLVRPEHGARDRREIELTVARGVARARKERLAAW